MKGVGIQYAVGPKVLFLNQSPHVPPNHRACSTLIYEAVTPAAAAAAVESFSCHSRTGRVGVSSQRNCPRSSSTLIARSLTPCPKTQQHLAQRAVTAAAFADGAPNSAHIFIGQNRDPLDTSATLLLLRLLLPLPPSPPALSPPRGLVAGAVSPQPLVQAQFTVSIFWAWSGECVGRSKKEQRKETHASSRVWVISGWLRDWLRWKWRPGSDLWSRKERLNTSPDFASERGDLLR